MKEKTDFKSVSNSSCTDLFLTNQVFSFQNTLNVATGLSDFHKLVLNVLQTSVSKNNPKEISYRDYKIFNSNIFHDELYHAFSNLILDTCYMLHRYMLHRYMIHVTKFSLKC